MRRVGLLGGTFDPPHIGHLVVARQVGHALGLDEVRLMVAGQPWQKGDETDVTVRVAMVRAAVADDPRLGLELIEVDDDGPTYTTDTLRELAAREPDVAWYFLAGADTVAGMTTWHHADDLGDLATIVGVHRPGTPRPEVPFEVTWVDAVPRLDLSSSEIRRMVRAGMPVDDLVPASVLHKIQGLRLYRSGDAGD